MLNICVFIIKYVYYIKFKDFVCNIENVVKYDLNLKLYEIMIIIYKCNFIKGLFFYWNVDV